MGGEEVERGYCALSVRLWYEWRRGKGYKMRLVGIGRDGMVWWRVMGDGVQKGLEG